MPDCAAGIAGSRVVGVPHGIAPRRAAAPVPRAGTGADGRPARAGMLRAALWSARAWNPQAPHANTACDGRFDVWAWPQTLHVCDVCAGSTLTTCPALYASLRSRCPQPLAGRPRFRPTFCFTLRPGTATVPLAEAVRPLVFRSSITTVCAVSASRRLVWCVALSRFRHRFRCSLFNFPGTGGPRRAHPGHRRRPGLPQGPARLRTRADATVLWGIVQLVRELPLWGGPWLLVCCEWAHQGEIRRCRRPCRPWWNMSWTAGTTSYAACAAPPSPRHEPAGGWFGRSGPGRGWPAA